MNYGKGICPYCRAEFDKRTNVQIYCSGRCRKRARSQKLGSCIHNDGVDCIKERDCAVCAWNPGSGVSQNRLAIFLAGGSE